MPGRGGPAICTTAGMAGSLIVRALGDADYADWERLLAGSEQGSLYSHPTYLDALCRVSNARFTILGAFRGTELTGGVALYERRSTLGSYVGPRTLLYYNGLVFRNYETKYPSQRTSKTLEVMAALEQALRQRGFGHIILKNHHSVSDVRAFQVQSWQAIPTYTYVVSLENLPEQWTRVEQNLRRLITRCTTQEFRFTDDDDFDEYYRMHVQTVERKQAELYLSHEAFRAYYLEMRRLGFCRLYQARTPNGEAVSAQLVLLGPYPTSHTISAASHKDHLSSGATAFLRWRGFERLAAEGYKHNDLTDAALNSVTHFKSQLAGTLQTCFVLKSPRSAPFMVAHAGAQVMERGRGWRRQAAAMLRTRMPRPAALRTQS